MSQVALPHDTKDGPTKPEIRAVTVGTLDLRPPGHFVDVGSGPGAVTVEAARCAGPDRLAVTRRNLAADEYDADVTLREAEAPAGLPDDADAMFLGGSRNFEVVFDPALDALVLERLPHDDERVTRTTLDESRDSADGSRRESTPYSDFSVLVVRAGER